MVEKMFNLTKLSVICICGMAGSGKSTLAKKIAAKYDFKYYSGGDALKTIALEKGYRPLARGWWESKEGLSFLKKRSENFDFDKRVDAKLLEAAKKGRVVLDSWAMPWLIDKGFKIWLALSKEKRAERIAKRDRISYDNALKALIKKEDKTKNIYQRLYGFKLGEDFKPFHVILNTEFLTADDVFQVVCETINHLHLNK